ncbi:MAG: hypothetical protein AB7P04_14890 [Bacteriovoracia bacterium]
MKTITIGILISCFVFAAVPRTVWAGEGHGHNHEAAVEPAPHGGILRDAPPYKSELLLKGEVAKIYVYDKGLKLAPLKTETLEAKIRFPKEKKDRTVIFKREADYFVAPLPGISKVHRYDLHVTLKEGPTSTLIDFGVDNIH